MKPKWLLSSGGRRGALVRLLQDEVAGGCSVVVTDAQYLSAAGHLAHEFHTVPRISDERFVANLLEIASISGVNFILPTLDPELPVLAAHRGLFTARGIEVLVSAPSVTELSADKWKFHEWLVANSLPTVQTWEASHLERISVSTPLIAKPRNGSSSIGIHSVKDAKQLPSLHLDCSYIVQEIAPGIEFTVDFAIDKSGLFLGAVPRRRLEVRAGEVSKGVTVRNETVEAVVEQLARQLDGAYGVLNVQLFLDVTTGRVSIIELNARVGGGYPLTHAAGADFLTAISSGGGAPDWRDGIVMLRYDDAVFFESTEFGV